MKKSKNKLILILAIILIMLVIIGLVADARYQTMLSGIGNASIANWSFKLVDAAPQTTDVIELAVTRTDGSDKVAEGKMAPGTYGEFEIGIDARGTETALEYTIEISLENAPRNLIFYTDETRTEVLEIENSKVTQIGEMTLEEVNEIRTEKIYWEWPYETGETDSDIITNDEEDTQDSGKDVTMQITVTGVQMIEKVELNTAWEMSYSGQVEEFIVPVSGTYQLELWGAQGGTGNGGKGGYSAGTKTLAKNTVLFIVVGEQPSGKVAGYNGGGTGVTGTGGSAGGGGGATHIATETGLLSEFSENQEAVLIVAGGGGGGASYGSNSCKRWCRRWRFWNSW